MIGRWRVGGVLAALALGILLALRPASAGSANPAVEAERTSHALEVARRATSELDALHDLVDGAIHDARNGSALVISGSDPPAPALEAAAATLEQGSRRGTDAIGAVALLAATLQAARPTFDAPRLDLGPSELLGIASQLRQSADAATPFVERRWAAEATLNSLASAVEALSADRPDAAMAAIAAARQAREAVAAWEDPPPELAVWLDTTGKMLAASQGIAEALANDDMESANAAGDAYRAAAQQAGQADRALALSIAEVGSSITATPLQRLAAVSQAVDDARSMVDEVARLLGG